MSEKKNPRLRVLHTGVGLGYLLVLDRLEGYDRDLIEEYSISHPNDDKWVLLSFEVDLEDSGE